jgi:hypothetical protein
MSSASTLMIALLVLAFVLRASQFCIYSCMCVRRVSAGMHAVFITACYGPVIAEARFIVYKRIRRRGVVCAALHTWSATLEPLLLPGWGGCTCNRMKCAGCD